MRISATLSFLRSDNYPPFIRYNAATSDANHVRLLERRSRAYTCRELMCIVFLPCLLICLLGIACSALVIYYQLDKVSKWVKEEGGWVH